MPVFASVNDSTGPSSGLGLGLGGRPAGPGGIETQRMYAAISARLFEGDTAPVRIGRFEIRHRLGCGGMGVVFAADDPELGRRVAVKVVRAGVHDGRPDRAGARMLREAKALARLSHPHVVAIHDVGLADDGVFIAMEYVDGWTLGELCRRDPPGTAERAARMIDLARQAAEGLRAAHAGGLVHRDLKPGNLLVGRDGRLRVADFGLARDLGDHSPWLPPTLDPMPTSELLQSDASVTASRALVGTPAYMAPEQFDGRGDALSDQFSWALTFWEALYGTRPFQGDTLMAVWSAMDVGRISPPPRGSHVPAWMRRVLTRALRAEPERRFPSMAAVLSAMGSTRPRPVRAMMSIGVLGLGGLVVGGLASEAAPPCGDAASTLARDDWNADRQRRVRTAIEAIGSPIAERVWAKIGPDLDAYAEQWQRARRSACERAAAAPDEPHESDAQIACLDARRRAFRQLVDVLGAADRDGAVRAQALVEGLPSLQACEDGGWLDAEVKPPEDPEVALAVADERERLARATHQQKLAMFEAAFEEASAVVDRAERIGYSPLLAEALTKRAEIALARYDGETAIEDLRTAYFLAAANGDAVLGARAASHLAGALSERHHDTEGALGWLEHAVSMLRRLPRPPVELEALVLDIRAAAMYRGGRLEEGLEASRAAERLLESAEDSDVALASALSTRMNLHKDLGEFDAAEQAGLRALDLQEAALGSYHPKVGSIALGLCGVYAESLRYEQAVPMCERAVETFETAFGPEHRESAMALHNLALVVRQRGDHARAVELLRESLGVFERVEGPDGVYVANVLNTLGITLNDLGRHDEANRVLDRALVIRRSRSTGNDLELAYMLYNMGTIAQQAHDYERAHRLLDETIEIMSVAVAPDHPVILYALSAKSTAYLEQGNYPAGIETLRRAIAGYERRTEGVDRVYEGIARFHLADALLATGVRGPEPIRQAEQALAILEAAQPEGEAIVEVRKLLRQH